MKEETKNNLTCWVTGGFVHGDSKEPIIWPCTWHIRLKDEEGGCLWQDSGNFRKIDMFIGHCFFTIEKMVRFKFAVSSFFKTLKTPLNG